MVYPQLSSCRICPRYCGVNRYEGTGFCRAGSKLKINLTALHHGEEPPISGSRGSGTIFFSWCNLRCVFCQNYSISAKGWGYQLGTDDLVNIMLSLQEQQAHNINLVTPTHFSPLIADAIIKARNRGMMLPIVWNSSAYECTETLDSLNGLVDIYLPDLKYAHGVYARKYSSAPDYPQVAMKAIKTMFQQTGTLQLDAEGIAMRGMIIRLLVLPNKLSGVQTSLRNLADELGTDASISLMAQYYPAGKATDYPELNRGVTKDEYQQAVNTAVELGFKHVYTQEISCSSAWTPVFTEGLEQQCLSPITSVNPIMENYI